MSELKLVSFGQAKKCGLCHRVFIEFLKGFYYERNIMRFSLFKDHSDEGWIEKKKTGSKKLVRK